MHQLQFVRGRRGAWWIAACAIATLVAMTVACEDDTGEPVPPESIQRVSGDGQYSKRGTTLPEPMVVRVTVAGGTAAAATPVSFQVVEGSASLSSSEVFTNGDGLASVLVTLGNATGPVRVRASVVVNTDLRVEFSATSSDYFCPEEDPVTPRNYAATNNLYLLTGNSSIITDGVNHLMGVVRVEQGTGDVSTSALSTFPETTVENVPRDCAFSGSGDFFVARKQFLEKVFKIRPDGSAEEFAILDNSFTELVGMPHGILAGCDISGVFLVGCGGVPTRFAEADYSATPGEWAGEDALAVDPDNDDLYFIHFPDNKLMRLPVDSLTATGPVEEVAQLSQEQAEGANGMVVDDNDYAIYILVDTDNTKEIVKVTQGGVVSTEFDFTSRGAGDAAGIQSDLAINQNFRWLYTLDTLNGVILLYEISIQQLTELPPDALSDPSSLSSSAGGGEPVGLVVVP